jgi:putative exporter of polyketide antibiotics
MSDLAATPVLVRLALRHDRVRLGAWIGGMCVLLAGIADG